jgi:hypothetical protein
MRQARLACSNWGFVAKDDELGDQPVLQREIEREDQGIRQVGLVEGSVELGVDGDITVAIPGPMNHYRHIVPEDFFGTERADRLSANEFARDIIEQGVRGERRQVSISWALQAAIWSATTLGRRWVMSVVTAISFALRCTGLDPSLVSFRQETLSNPLARRDGL